MCSEEERTIPGVHPWAVTRRTMDRAFARPGSKLRFPLLDAIQETSDLCRNGGYLNIDASAPLTRWTMDVLAGLLAALAILGLGKATRQADAISFYSTVLIIIALVYVLFAVMAGRTSTIVVESGIAAVFVGLAVGGARWDRVQAAGVLIAVGLMAHGAYDLAHDALIANAVVPGWWPTFCGIVDVTLGAWLGTCAVMNRLKSRLPTA